MFEAKGFCEAGWVGAAEGPQATFDGRTRAEGAKAAKPAAGSADRGHGELLPIGQFRADFLFEQQGFARFQRQHRHAGSGTGLRSV